MRALDCRDPSTHDDIHFSSEDDDQLFAEVQSHTQEHHPEMTDEDIRQMIATSAYDE
jgi:hypothetical protein